MFCFVAFCYILLCVCLLFLWVLLSKVGCVSWYSVLSGAVFFADIFCQLLFSYTVAMVFGSDRFWFVLFCVVLFWSALVRFMVSSSVLFCCAVLLCDAVAVLLCAVRCCSVLFCSVLSCAGRFCAIVCSAVLSCAALCIAVLCRDVLLCSVLLLLLSVMMFQSCVVLFLVCMLYVGVVCAA